MNWWASITSMVIVLVMTLVTSAFPVDAMDEQPRAFSYCVDEDCLVGNCVKQPCFYGECNKHGECVCDHCWTGRACNESACSEPNHEKMIDSYVPHHRTKRSVAPPSNLEFSLTKSPDTVTNLRVGMTIEFTLTIKLPAQNNQQLRVELFTPDNSSTIMALCDVRIHSVGSVVTDRTAVEGTAIKMDAKASQPIPYDRAILDFGTVSCCTGTATIDSQFSIVIKFAATMWADSAPTGNLWVSAGAEYKNSQEVWIGQASFTRDDTAPTGGEEPQIVISEPTPSTVRLGVPFQLSLNMKLTEYALDPLSVDIIAPLQTTSILSACGILVSKTQGNNKNFKCVSQDHYQSVAYKDSEGVANSRARIELGRVVNTGVYTNNGSRPFHNGNDNTIELMLYMMFIGAPGTRGKAVAGTAYKVGMAVEMGSQMIWAGEKSITPQAQTGLTFTEAITPDITMKSPSITTAAEGGIVSFDLVMEVPTASDHNGPGKYKVEASMPVDESNKAQLGICRMEVVSHGWNVPCVVPPDEPVFTKTNPEGLNDRGEWVLGPLVNMNGALNSTNSSANEVLVRIYASVAKGVPVSTQLNITVGVYIGSTKLWVGHSEKITVGAVTTTSSADAVANAPTFGLKYTFDTTDDIPLNSVTEVELQIKTKRSKEYGMMDLEIMMPSNSNNEPLMKVCKAEVVFSGKNLPCFDVVVANNSIEYKNRSDITDRALLSVGQTCNVGSYNSDQEDKIIIRALIRVLSADGNSLPYSTHYSAGVMYSTTTLWVGQTTLDISGSDTAKLNTTAASQLGLYVEPADGDTNAQIGLCKQYLVKIKIPPQSRATYKLKVTSLTTTGSVCSMTFVRAGINYMCEDFNEDGRLPRANVTDDLKTVETDLGIITNPVFYPGFTDDREDNTTVVMDFWLTVGALAGHQYKVDLIYTTASGEQTKSNTTTVTGIAYTPGATNVNNKPTITISNIQLTNDDDQPNNNVVKGQAVRLLYKAKVKANTENKMLVEVRCTTDGVMDFSNIGLLFRGMNVPCVAKPEPPYNITSTGSTKDTISIDLGVVKYLAVNTTNSTDDELHIEVIGRIRLSTTSSGSVPVVFKTYYDSLADENTINLNVLTTDTYEEFNSTNDLSVVFNDPPSPFNVKVGEIYSVTSNTTIPVLSAAKTTMDCEAPYVEATKHAKAVIVDMKVVSAGLNLAGLELDTYTPTFHTKNDIQNSRAVLQLGIVTNTGFTQRHAGNMTDQDNQIVVECVYRVADEPNEMTASSTFPISVGIKAGGLIVISDITNTLTRTGSERPIYTVNTTIDHPSGTKFSRGSQVKCEVSFAHQYDSTAEGLNAQLLVFLPYFTEFDTSVPVANTSGRLPDEVPTTTPTPTAPQYIKFKWNRFLFPENATITFTLKIKADAHLPSGKEADLITVPVDYGSSMKTRTGNTASSGFIPSSEMSAIQFDAHNIPPPPPDGATCSTEKVLGMQTSVIKDCQISGSMESNSDILMVRPGAGGWKPYVRAGSLRQGRYLQVYLGPNKYTVTKVVLTKKSVCKITHIKPRFSSDGGGWAWGSLIGLSYSGDSAVASITGPSTNYFRVYLWDDDCLGQQAEVEIELKGCDSATPTNTPAYQCPPLSVFSPAWQSPDSSYRSMVTTDAHMIFCDVLRFGDLETERRCIRHVKDTTGGLKFTRLNKVVASVLGYEPTRKYLFGMASDDKSYLLSKDNGATWNTVPKEAWEKAKAAARQAVKIPWKPELELKEGIYPKYVIENTYGADYKGVHKKSGSTWTQIADWSTY